VLGLGACGLGLLFCFTFLFLNSFFLFDISIAINNVVAGMCYIVFVY
jgi:hypothetical protein